LAGVLIAVSSFWLWNDVGRHLGTVSLFVRLRRDLRADLLSPSTCRAEYKRVGGRANLRSFPLTADGEALPASGGK